MTSPAPAVVLPHGKAPAMPAPRRRLSGILTDLAAVQDAARISVAEILAAMEDRAFGALLLVFALPNVIPMPPGAGILGVPLLLLSVQMMLGRSPWLPAAIRLRSLDPATFRRLVAQLVPPLQRAERALRPRFTPVLAPACERLLGGFCLLMAFVLFLPLPFGNTLPALSLCVVALGLLERDGLWVVGGIALGCVALSVVGGVLYLLLTAAIFFVGT